jgi:hypothetical protein
MSLILNKKFILFISTLLIAFLVLFSVSAPTEKELKKENSTTEKSNEIKGTLPENPEEREKSGWDKIPNSEELDRLTRVEYGGEVIGISYWQDAATNVFYARVELALDDPPFPPYAYYKNSEGVWSEVDENNVPDKAKNL